MIEHLKRGKTEADRAEDDAKVSALVETTLKDIEDRGDAAVLEESLEKTCANLGEDGDAWRKLMKPFTDHSMALFDEILRPIRLLPRHPFLMARFGLVGLQSATMIARRFKTARAKALFAGCAAHSFVPLTRAGSASFGLALAIAGHATGWPAAKGGSFAIIQALASLLRLRVAAVLT